MGNSMDMVKEAKRVLLVEAEAVRAMADRVGVEFERAVEIIHTSQGRVIVSGMGKSGLVGKKVAATLSSTGTPAFSLHPAEASHGDLGMVKKDDVFLAISNSGETEEILGLIPFMKRFGISLVSMTGNGGSTLAVASDVHLDTSVSEEACPMGIVPTASTTAALAMGDALAVALLIRQGFMEEDFALFHPKGSLGKKLLIKTKDLMHSGRRIPSVSPETPMAETVVEMSSKRLGITMVLNEGGEILGVVTDGDLRRGLEKWGDRLFQMKAGEVMSRNPKGIGEDALAAEALSVMQRHSITALLVLGSGGGVAGIIHIHEILKEGIV
jgi:arabinose-5-phosphate isomerase